MRYKKILVDVETPLEQQLRKLKITKWINLSKITHLRKIPRKNYWIYDVESGEEMLNKSPEKCLEIFKKKKRIAGNIYEALALYRHDPEILKRHWIDTAGSRFGRASVPFLGLCGAGPRLRAYDAGHAHSYSGAASFGSFEPLKVETLEEI